MAIAIAYGVIFFLGSWTLGGSGLLGEHAALPNEWRVFPERWGLAVAFAALVALLVLTSQRHERIDLWGEARLSAAVGGRLGHWSIDWLAADWPLALSECRFSLEPSSPLPSWSRFSVFSGFWVEVSP
ncbi:MAG: hypothetical protein MI920_18430 [Kiloniellales bacterium]|nr:hypothetical protein [Kiloniellales bacterium]